VRPLQVGGVDLSEMGCERRLQRARFDQRRRFVEQIVLLDHVRRLEGGAGEHEFPGEAHALAHQRRQIHRLLRRHDGAYFSQ